MAATVEAVTQATVHQEQEYVVRFDIHQRIQHFLMMSSFIVLALTGLPLKFDGLAISQWWIGFWGGIESTRFAHRIAAFVMVGDCVYHVAYLLYTTLLLKRPFPFQMFPSPRDLQDLLADLKYYLGLSPARARYGRFNYREKFDYWAIFWGMPIMAGSGFILMYPVLVSKLLPGWAIPVALVAHSDEAVLAVSWIFIVHIFFSHLTPKVFPLNKSIFTGRVPRERYWEEHPLELQLPEEAPGEPEVTGETKAPPPDGAAPETPGIASSGGRET
ncbi:MAG: hypothetical protein HYX99_01185 [Chloroflexi bacterium]|nr:hypothetical protein [Chloroflexota bacterium]